MPLFSSSVLAESFYLGTQTRNSSSQGIYQGSLDPETGALGPIQLAAEAVSPGFLTVSPDGRFLYSVMEENEAGAVGAFALQPDGRAIFLNSQPSGGKGACHVAMDAPGRHVLVANYTSGSAAGFPVEEDGKLGSRTAFYEFSGSGPNPKRQTKSYAHAIAADAEDRFLYVCDLGADKVWTFRYQAADGTWQPAGSGSVPPGGGPRHLAFHPNGRFVYVNNEMGLSVTVFSRDAGTGQLTPLQTLSTLPPGVPGDAAWTTSEILCHPNGSWLYVSNRAHDSIAVYRIGEDGLLEWLETVPAQVQVPRGMSLDPTGKWLVVAGQKDNRITVLKVDSATGRLSATGHFEDVPAPICVAFVPPSSGRQ